MLWLSQGGPRSKKHVNLAHPITTLFVHYFIVSLFTFSCHDWILAYYYRGQADVRCADSPNYRRTVALCLGLYSAWLLLWRLWILHSRRYCVLYQYTWLCNVTLVLSALGLYWDRPIIATAYCVAGEFLIDIDCFRENLEIHAP
jgi:hypothetical protein